MKRLVILALTLMVTTGCARQYGDFFAYDDDGAAKPVVAVLPIKDSSWNSLPWSMSEELEVGIWDAAKRRGRLYCTEPTLVKDVVAQLGDDIDVHTQDAGFYKQFVGCEFLVLVDILQHNEMPYHRGEIEPLYIIDDDDAFVLGMKVRVTVLDVTGSAPRVALKEIFSSNHMIEKEYYDVDYSLNRWGTKDYRKTPIGVAHERLARDLTARIETVTAAATSLAR